MARVSQIKRITDYIMEFGSITALEAFRDLGVMRLAARIADLEDLGYEIKRENVNAKNRYGDTVHYTKYSFA